MLDINAIRSHLTAVCEQYDKTAPTVAVWADDLYIRINDDPYSVRLPELGMAVRLLQDGEWMHPNYAANALYHHMHRMGQDTTGHASF